MGPVLARGRTRFFSRETTFPSFLQPRVHYVERRVAGSKLARSSDDERDGGVARASRALQESRRPLRCNIPTRRCLLMGDNKSMSDEDVRSVRKRDDSIKRTLAR